MNITCPRCGFSRQVPADRLPARAVIATCPHCACRFRFGPSTGEHEVLPDAPQAEQQETAHGGNAGTPAASAQDAAPDVDGPSPARGPEEDDPLPPGAIVPGSSPGTSGRSGRAGQEAHEEYSSREETDRKSVV